MRANSSSCSNQQLLRNDIFSCVTVLLSVYHTPENSNSIIAGTNLWQVVHFNFSASSHLLTINRQSVFFHPKIVRKSRVLFEKKTLTSYNLYCIVQIIRVTSLIVNTLFIGFCIYCTCVILQIIKSVISDNKLQIF